MRSNRFWATRPMATSTRRTFPTTAAPGCRAMPTKSPTCGHRSWSEPPRWKQNGTRYSPRKSPPLRRHPRADRPLLLCSPPSGIKVLITTAFVLKTPTTTADMCGRVAWPPPWHRSSTTGNILHTATAPTAIITTPTDSSPPILPTPLTNIH